MASCSSRGWREGPTRKCWQLLFAGLPVSSCFRSCLEAPACGAAWKLLLAGLPGSSCQQNPFSQALLFGGPLPVLACEMSVCAWLALCVVQVCKFLSALFQSASFCLHCSRVRNQKNKMQSAHAMFIAQQCKPASGFQGRSSGSTILNGR